MDIKLHELVGGALEEKFEESFEKVIHNLRNINTPYKEKRKIIIELTFSQDESRNNVSVDAKIREKLASASPIRTSLFVEQDLATGEMYCEEMGRYIKGQRMLGEYIEEQAAEQEQEKEILDFRKAKTL